MSKTDLAGVVLLATASLSAQATHYWYSPASLAKGEGDGYAYYLGRYIHQRMQQIDAELRGKVGCIKEISMRLDARSYQPNQNAGRTFRTVTINIADSDFANASQAFAMNHKSPPTCVFSASVTWPTVRGLPQTRPAPWGGATGAYRFPFKSSWLTLGTKDIVSDWEFSNGRLSNGSTNSQMPYYFDSHYYTTSQHRYGVNEVGVPTTRLDNKSPGVTGRCNDSSLAYSTGAHVYGILHAYGPNSTIHANWRNKIVLQSHSHYTAPGAPVVHAWGVLPNYAGVDIGTGCNRLYIRTVLYMQPCMTLPATVWATGGSGYSAPIIFPLLPSAAGLTLIAQAAWADSKTGKLGLSQGRAMDVPNLDFRATPPRRLAVTRYKYSWTGAWYGPYGPYDHSVYQTGFRYGY